MQVSRQSSESSDTDHDCVSDNTKEQTGETPLSQKDAPSTLAGCVTTSASDFISTPH